MPDLTVHSPRRKLGLVAATALVMGTMIGSGVFLLPASLAPFGWNAVGGWMLTIAGALVIAKVLADLTRRHVGHANATSFVRAAFGPVPEFMVAWVYLVSVWTAVVTVAVAAISYLSSLVPELAASDRAATLSVIALIWAVTLINMRSVRTAGGFQVLTLAIKVVPLVVVIALAAVALSSGAAAPPPFEPSKVILSALNGAAVLTLWALVGFETASIAAQQVEDPARNVARATLWGTALTGLLYLFVCSAIALLLPAEVAAASPAPFATFVERFWGAGPAALIALFAVVSCVGTINGLTLMAGELPRTMAEDGLLPAWIGGTDAAGTPRRALLVSALVASALALMNESGGLKGAFEFLLLLSTSATLWLFLALALAAFKLGVSRGLAVVGAAYALWTLWGAGLWGSGLSLVLMVAGLPLYGWALRGRSAEQPVQP